MSSDSPFDCQDKSTPGEAAIPAVSSDLQADCYYPPAAATPEMQVTIPTLLPNVSRFQVNSATVPVDSYLANTYFQTSDSVVQIDVSDASGRHVGDASGFFVRSDGLVATALHVLSNGSRFQVTTTSGQRFLADVVAIDRPNELSLLRLENHNPYQNFPALPLGTSSMKSGEPLMALGHPNGIAQVFASPGIFQNWQPFSSVYNFNKASQIPYGMNIHRPMIISTMQTQPGDSGGPILDPSGNVVGVMDLSNGLNRVDATPVEPLEELLGKL